MSPTNATSKSGLGYKSQAWAEALAAIDLADIRMHMAEERAADEYDEVATGYRGNKTLKSAGGTNDDDAPTRAHSDVISDRVPSDAESKGNPDRAKTSPLEIQEIESLEDDAKGG